MDNITALSNPEVIPKIGALLAAIAKDPSLYRMVVASTPSLEELTEIHETHQSVYNASGSGDPEILRQLQAARKRMDYKYGIFFSLLKHAAVENPDLPAKLGISQSKPKKATAQMTSPLNPRARHTETSGQMLLKVDPVKGAKSYDISFCQGDPSIEANWKHCGVGTKASRLLVEGLVPGSTYWFRVRAFPGLGRSSCASWRCSRCQRVPDRLRGDPPLTNISHPLALLTQDAKAQRTPEEQASTGIKTDERDNSLNQGVAKVYP